MSNPWMIYDALIDDIDARIRVTAANTGLQWGRVTSSEDGIGMAAINAFYGHPDRADSHGLTRSEGNWWRQVFHPYSNHVVGKTVVVVGHFPFAPEPLAAAAELIVLERSPLPGDYPDPACEYVLPDCDYAFISSSAFVNKTAPRLLELARRATTILVGPSTPLAPMLFEHGVDVITGLVSPHPQQLDDALANIAMAGMHDAGYRVERHLRADHRRREFRHD